MDQQRTNKEMWCPFVIVVIRDDVKVQEEKPPLVNDQCVVYKFKYRHSAP